MLYLCSYIFIGSCSCFSILDFSFLTIEDPLFLLILEVALIISFGLFSFFVALELFSWEGEK
jgi:hypothetical protein